MSTLLTRVACERAALARSEQGRLRAHALAGARQESSPGPTRLDASDAHAGGRLTLEQRLDSVWEGLRAVGAAECPVCGGRMEGLEHARCTSCGSELF